MNASPLANRGWAPAAEKAFAELEHREGRAPNDEELAQHLGHLEITVDLVGHRPTIGD